MRGIHHVLDACAVVAMRVNKFTRDELEHYKKTGGVRFLRTLMDVSAYALTLLDAVDETAKEYREAAIEKTAELTAALEVVEAYRKWELHPLNKNQLRVKDKLREYDKVVEK